ncbi:MAG: hypothetical protein QOH61_2729 [Chloroflexota bacterium]|nr:hypothetical protein [Chloroflexota bacterium]
MLLASSVALILLTAAPAAADCSRSAPASNIGAYRGTAFIATVTGLESHTSGPWDITLDVERVLAGDVNSPVAAWDLGGSCGQLNPAGLRIGERILVSLDRFQTFVTSSFGNVLIWREDGPGRWRFDGRALRSGNNRDPYYPASARAATTTEEILDLVVRSLPPTDARVAVAVATPRPARTHLTAALAALTAALTAGAWLSFRLRSRLVARARTD